MVVNTIKNGKVYKDLNNIVTRVSSIIENTGKYESVRSNEFPDRNVGSSDSNFLEDPEMLRNVWSNTKIDMKGTINSLVSSLSNSFDSKDVENQVKLLKGKEKNRGKIMHFSSPNKLIEMERKVQYGSVQKGMKRWGRVIDNINRQEVINYGEMEKTDILSATQLSTNYEPMDEFEKEFERVLLEVGNENTIGNSINSNNVTLLPCNKIKSQMERNFVKKLKFILFNQQRESKRLKKIKSKTWRKNRRKQAQIEEEKLLSLGKVEYPELVKSLIERYEEKRAKIRLMRRQSARQKWAKMAARFGGKEIQKDISNQAQIHQDEKKRIEQIINNFSTDMENDDINSDIEENIPKYIDKSLKVVSELKSISKELSDLKFIQRGIDSKNEELNSKLNEFREAFGSSESNQNENKEIVSETVTHEIELKKPTFDEVNSASNEILDKIGVDNDIYLSISINKADDTQELCNSKEIVTKMHEKDLRSANNFETDIKKQNFNIQDELEKMAQIYVEENISSNTQNKDSIKEIFVHSGDNILPQASGNQSSSKKECNYQEKTTVPGWGNWCVSLTEIKMNENEKNILEKKKTQIKQNKRLDRKIASYCVNKAPYPFNSNDLYESTFKHPIGPEWNTTSIHNKLIQPKIQTRIGAVIKPLMYSKRLKNIDISDSFLKKWNEVKKCNRTKARF